MAPARYPLLRTPCPAQEPLSPSAVTITVTSLG